MTVLIKDKETDQLIRTLAERTGESITGAVKTAIQERLKQIPISEDEIAARKRKLAEILAKIDSLPTMNDHLTNDEIIGYDENGLAT